MIFIVMMMTLTMKIKSPKNTCFQASIVQTRKGFGGVLGSRFLILISRVGNFN